MFGKQIFQLGPGKEPDQIAGGACQFQKQPCPQQPPEGSGIGQHEGAQRRKAEQDDLHVGQVDQQSGPKARLPPVLLRSRPGTAQHVPGQIEDIGRADPGEVLHIGSQHIPQQAADEHGGHAVDEKAGGQAPPLPQGDGPPVAQGRGQGAEVRRARRDGGDIAVQQERRQNGDRHENTSSPQGMEQV